MPRKTLGTIFILLIYSGIALAAHPLITDDTGTQGKGKFQLEANYEFSNEDSGGVNEDFHQFQAVLSYGVIDTVDVVAALPYQFIRSTQGGLITDENGISDLSVEVKWRFFERERLSFAIKPGISFPTGDEDKGLGPGRVGGSIFLIASQELEPWAFHFNVGYGRNENTADERREIWHVSIASEVEVSRWMRVVGNIGMEQNTDKGSDTPAAFLLGGVIVPVNDCFEISLGLKGGLTRPEADISVLSGVTMRF
jgi:hypothetical protein